MYAVFLWCSFPEPENTAAKKQPGFTSMQQPGNLGNAGKKKKRQIKMFVIKCSHTHKITGHNLKMTAGVQWNFTEGRFSGLKVVGKKRGEFFRATHWYHSLQFDSTRSTHTLGLTARLLSQLSLKRLIRHRWVQTGPICTSEYDGHNMLLCVHTVYGIMNYIWLYVESYASHLC